MQKEGRYDSLLQIVSRFGPIATAVNRAGVSLRFINSKVDAELNGIQEPDIMDAIFSSIRPRGFTPIGTNLRRKIIDPFLAGLRNSDADPKKPLLVVIITDGEVIQSKVPVGPI